MQPEPHTLHEHPRVTRRRARRRRETKSYHCFSSAELPVHRMTGDALARAHVRFAHLDRHQESHQRLRLVADRHGGDHAAAVDDHLADQHGAGRRIDPEASARRQVAARRRAGSPCRVPALAVFDRPHLGRHAEHRRVVELAIARSLNTGRACRDVLEGEARLVRRPARNMQRHQRRVDVALDAADVVARAFCEDRRDLAARGGELAASSFSSRASRSRTGLPSTSNTSRSSTKRSRFEPTSRGSNPSAASATVQQQRVGEPRRVDDGLRVGLFGDDLRQLLLKTLDVRPRRARGRRRATAAAQPDAAAASQRKTAPAIAETQSPWRHGVIV